ncbi:MAG: hypothetical protein ACR2M0_01340 [Chloroflexia bacterium]
MKIGVRFVLFLGVLLCSLALTAGQALAATGETQQTVVTAHYKIVLTIGPEATMLTPEQAAGAKVGEVMLPMGGMAMPAMGMTDLGRPVNRHLEVAILDKTSGAPVTDQMPAISIKNDVTGDLRTLSSVMAMYDVKVGKNDTHFGNNIYLPDGTYTFTTVANGETATFTNVVLGAAGNMSGGSTMPSTGEPLTGLYAALFVTGGLVLVAGLWLRRSKRV